LLKAFYKTEEPEAILSAETAQEEADNSYERWAERAQGDWRSFLCFDVEATCRGGKEFDWPNEIIVSFRLATIGEGGDTELIPGISRGPPPLGRSGGDCTRPWRGFRSSRRKRRDGTGSNTVPS
jgi:hypothetical protein